MAGFGPMIDALFRNPVLGVDAVYRPGGADPGVTVRLITRAPDRLTNFGEGRFVAETMMADVRIADAPDLARGDTFEISGRLFEVRSDPVRDSERLIWAADLLER